MVVLPPLWRGSQPGQGDLWAQPWYKYCHFPGARCWNRCLFSHVNLQHSQIQLNQRHEEVFHTDKKKERSWLLGELWPQAWEDLWSLPAIGQQRSFKWEKWREICVWCLKNSSSSSAARGAGGGKKNSLFPPITLTSQPQQKLDQSTCGESRGTGPEMQMPHRSNSFFSTLKV